MCNMTMSAEWLNAKALSHDPRNLETRSGPCQITFHGALPMACSR